ncbi:hypothetical protein DAI22_12g179600 [Oryza sativa Japonica Group]|nr:hypothetical protein DAI22_12g179600 [Oryza sativa Japonica Group]
MPLIALNRRLFMPSPPSASLPLLPCRRRRRRAFLGALRVALVRRRTLAETLYAFCPHAGELAYSPSSAAPRRRRTTLVGSRLSRPRRTSSSRPSRERRSSTPTCSRSSLPTSGRTSCRHRCWPCR